MPEAHADSTTETPDQDESGRGYEVVAVRLPAAHQPRHGSDAHPHEIERERRHGGAGNVVPAGAVLGQGGRRKDGVVQQLDVVVDVGAPFLHGTEVQVGTVRLGVAVREADTKDALDPIKVSEVRVEGGGVVHVADNHVAVDGDVLPVVRAEGQGHEGHRSEGADRGQAQDDRAAVVVGGHCVLPPVGYSLLLS